MPISRPEKLCAFCVHFRWRPSTSDREAPGYVYNTEVALCDAPRTKAQLTSDTPLDAEEFRQLILRAENCRSYSPLDTTKQGASNG